MPSAMGASKLGMGVGVTCLGGATVGLIDVQATRIRGNSRRESLQAILCHVEL